MADVYRLAQMRGVLASSLDSIATAPAAPRIRQFAQTYRQITHTTFDVLGREPVLLFADTVLPLFETHIPKIDSYIRQTDYKNALAETYGALSGSHSLIRNGLRPNIAMSLLPGIPVYVPSPEDN